MRPPFRVPSVLCPAENKFHISVRFSDFAIPAHKVEGSLSKPDTTYRTVFGPLFSHSATVYANCDTNISKALTRTTNSRSGDPEADRIGRANQARWLNGREMAKVREHLLSAYRSNERTYDYDEQLYEYAHAPHPKRKLRVEAWRELIVTGLTSLGTRSVKAKLKKLEFAKPGKYPRLVVDMTTPASLISGFAAKVCKDVMSLNPYSGISFVPDSCWDSLHDAFIRLRDDAFCYVYFSDDSCFAVNCLDGRLMMNMDISSCDTSHSPELFRFMLSTMPESRMRDYIKMGVRQLTLPLDVQNARGTKCFTLRPREPTLYSGSTLTTLTNNYANLSIGATLLGIDFSRLSVDEAEQMVNDMAKLSGYSVTTQRCRNLQQLQFLKHSPNSRCEPWLNLGTILRTLGQCKGDLPGRQKQGLKRRAQMFMAGITASMVHSGNHAITHALRREYGQDSSAILTGGALERNYIYGRSCDVSLDDIAQRYSLTPDEVEELANVRVAYATIHRGVWIDKVYKLDYGYDAPVTSSIDIPAELCLQCV